MTDGNGTAPVDAPEEVEATDLTEDEPDAREVEADGLVQQLREELRAAQVDREKVGEELTAAKAERAEVAELKAEAEASLERAAAAEEQATTAQQQSATSVSQAQKSATAAQKHAESVSATNDTVKTTLGSVTTNAETIAEHRAQVEEDAEATGALARKAEAVEARIKKYEVGFDERNARADALADRVEGLLPGAASAGLAHSYRKSKESKDGPKRFWLWAFISTIALIVGSLFLPMPWFNPAGDVEGLNGWYLLARLPVVLPLSFFAGVALVHFRVESRIQDDYRHKEDLAATYEGFRKQMSEETFGSGAASYDLAQQTLATIHAEPGRMYDSKREVYTPAEGFINAVAERAAQMIRKSSDADS